MNKKQENEHARLLRLWARGRATRKQMERCHELDRIASNEAIKAALHETPVEMPQ